MDTLRSSDFIFGRVKCQKCDLYKKMKRFFWKIFIKLILKNVISFWKNNLMLKIEIFQISKNKI